jgi:hypothetical protein
MENPFMNQYLNKEKIEKLKEAGLFDNSILYTILFHFYLN